MSGGIDVLCVESAPSNATPICTIGSASALNPRHRESRATTDYAHGRESGGDGACVALGARESAVSSRVAAARIARPMPPDRWYFYGIVALVVAGVASFAALLFIPAPYGRYERAGWGPTIPARLGWLLQELPAPLLFAIVFFRGEHAFRIVPLTLLLLWELHYGYRTFVYPLRLRPGAGAHAAFHGGDGDRLQRLNATLNAYAISHGVLRHTDAWFADPRFVAGVALFAIGWFVNQQSDAILRRLRQPGETGYKIPRGGLYRFVSCPNYLGEIVEWCGWALATWTYAGFAFAFFTAANLVPRAISHHRWYREQFADYPRERKAILPAML